MDWTVTFYDMDVEQEAHGLPPGLRARFTRFSERMEVHGPNLGMPHSRAMGEGLFELRLKAAEGIARVFYCAVVNRRIVILHSFVKKSVKTPHRELEVARRRLKEVKDG